MKYSVSLLLVALSIGLALSAPAEEPVHSRIAESTLKRVRLVTANDDFGFRVMQQIEQAEHVKSAESRKNVFISPLSINSVLAMLLAGGATDTYSQIYNTLGYNQFQFSNMDIFQTLHGLFSGLSHNINGKENVLSIANSIAVQKNFPILETFMSNITTHFESHVYTEDFAQKAHEATQELNSWVNEQTRGKIEKIFDQDLSPDTILVLLNAIYFKGTWKTKFAKEKTNKAMFHMNDHQEEIQMMNVKSHFNYAQLDDGQLLELPYQNGTLSMYIFLPPVSNQKSISSTFNSQVLSEKITHLREHTVNVHIPKFKSEQTYFLTSTLKKMGIVDALTPGKADFTNINGRRDLYLSDVIHKTFIEVNEEGSEAAAVTGGTIRHLSMPINPIPDPEFRADHPFMFFIRDNQYGVTLFEGIINKP